MQTWIVFIRGINVGGNNILKMADLRAILQSLGYQHVKTHIQSGNCVFQFDTPDPTSIGQDISAAIAAQKDFCPRVYAISLPDLKDIIAANPFRNQAHAEPKSVHFFFLMPANPPQSKSNHTVADYLRDDEAYFQNDRCFYLHTPAGLGQSKLADKLDRILGMATTARNWNTILKVLDLARTLD